MSELSTYELIEQLIKRYRKMEQQRDGLLAACKSALPLLPNSIARDRVVDAIADATSPAGSHLPAT